MAFICCTYLVTGQSKDPTCRAYTLDSFLTHYENVKKIAVVWSRPAVKRYGDPVYMDCLPANLDSAFQIVFKTQRFFTYKFTRKGALLIHKKTREEIALMPQNCKVFWARITDSEGTPLPRATIQFKDKRAGAVADEAGLFIITWCRGDILVISHINYRTRELAWNDSSGIVIKLEQEATAYDPAVVNGYVELSPLKNTATISRVLPHQPVNSTILESMRGQVAGAVFGITSGLPGASPSVNIRGYSSIGEVVGWHNRPTNYPLIVINGVPMPTLLQPLNQLTSIAGDPNEKGISARGLNPLYTINPLDIESVQVLKDAAATAIYGSRGDNGVIVLRTKRASGRSPKLTVSSFAGVGRITRAISLMNTREYLDMRYEAFGTDGTDWRTSNNLAGDLKVMDTSRYTDFKKWLLGGTAKITDNYISFSQGNSRFRSFISGSYHQESSVLPGDISGKRGSVTGDLAYYSKNQKLSAGFTAFTTLTKNNWISENVMPAMLLVPHAPDFMKSGDSLNWGEGNGTFLNPLSFFKNTIIIRTSNTLVHTHVMYKMGRRFKAEISLGYNNMATGEEARFPIGAKNPVGNPRGAITYAHNRYETYNLEPQLQYNWNNAAGNLKVASIVGGSLLKQRNTRSIDEYSGFSTDDSLGKPGAYTSFLPNHDKLKYRYLSGFSRVSASFKNQYLFSATFRMDASSRFGAKNRVARLGSAGASWIFLNRDTFELPRRVINFGKLRASTGITGNDQIGNYGFLNGYTFYSGSQLYQGLPALTAAALSNPLYQWEYTRKLEIALETSFFNRSVDLTLIYYRNRTTNQLINNLLPSQTGFSSIITNNFSAVVQNSGFELEAGINKEWKLISYSARLTLAIPRNKLLRFPGLELSPYKNTLVVGQSLTVEKILPYGGIHHQNGVYTVIDTIPRVAGNHDPKLLGGFVQTIGFRNRLHLQTIWEWRIQKASHYMLFMYNQLAPGKKNETYYMNQPADLVNHWKKEGDPAPWQKFSAKNNSTVNTAINYWKNSNAQLVNASFLLLKNIRLTYDLPPALIKKCGLRNAVFFANGENMVTVTAYEGADPQVADPLVLPPLKVITLGITLTL
jgi:TonB-dependent starch-binding outer membrane protein SusC